MFVNIANIFTADDKYSLLNRDHLKQRVQMILSWNLKNFSEFNSAFLKSMLKFENFQKKYDPHSWCIIEITDSVKGG